MKKTKIDHYTDKEALDFHKDKKPGKIEISSSKNMTTKRDLALAYSPGVAAPVRAISDNPEAAFDYTSKGNLVAVISNGSAILGMGNLGALASKPVMEGKAVLFKKTGVPQKNITMVDRTGVIYRGRDNLNQWKSSHAIETKDRTLDLSLIHI